jgi:hypothetical protein
VNSLIDDEDNGSVGSVRKSVLVIVVDLSEDDAVV